ncbi:carboxypeptidase regulatory-like domain-containing protein [Microbacterium sp. 179-B 1A2 NHS]|uniref:carboxypeptidase regulatory-like domain-containing protein n=1 Tax=Microbacterium sp. 179-B 1A2 NHS TaxID=3142383 RepID=UPI0039A1CB22
MHTDSRDHDEGFTLVEVIVAMLVFMIIVTGFLYTMTASLIATRDTRARVVAANLASQQIDLIRDVSSTFDVTNTSHDHDIQVNSDRYHVDVSTSWQTASGTTASCEAGAATGALAYKRISVEVAWGDGDDRSVHSDTAIAPASKINDPTLGTVLVGVVNSAGTAVSGATVSLSPSGGVASVSTDSDGCAYLLKVPAGTYTVTVSKTGYVSEQHVASPTADVIVTAGSSSRASFAYDEAATYSLTYAGNVAGTVHIPTDLTTSFVSTYGSSQFTATTSAKTKSYSLYPIPSGYSVLPGTYAETPGSPSTSCLSPDPSEWADAPGKVGLRPEPVAGTPGSTVPVPVPMGIVRLTNANGSGTHLKAVYDITSPGANGDPGCAAGMTYTFGSIVSSNSATFALPSGTWRLYRGNSSSQTSVVSSGISIVTGGTMASSNRVVVDPRVAG